MNAASITKPPLPPHHSFFCHLNKWSAGPCASLAQIVNSPSPSHPPRDAPHDCHLCNAVPHTPHTPTCLPPMQCCTLTQFGNFSGEPFPKGGLLRSGPYCGAALHRWYLMFPASAQLRVRPERKDGGHPALCNTPPQWLRMRHQSHQRQRDKSDKAPANDGAYSCTTQRVYSVFGNIGGEISPINKSVSSLLSCTLMGPVTRSRLTSENRYVNGHWVVSGPCIGLGQFWIFDSQKNKKNGRK